MQDFLEDYINISKNAKEESIKISKEVQISAQRKKECDARAMKIVEFSIEGKLRPEIFIRSIPFINQSHYQDIVEERAITKLCGYAICGKRIPDMPKKQYFISTKNNKVYDITDRKNYCSNFCYKASLHIKKQIDNGPLWLRKLEDIPMYHLLESKNGGLPGEFIDQGVVKHTADPAFTSIVSFTEASLDVIVNTEEPGKTLNKGNKGQRRSSKSVKFTMKTIDEGSEQVLEEIAKEIKSENRFDRKKDDSDIILSPDLPPKPILDKLEVKTPIQNDVEKSSIKGPQKKAEKKRKKTKQVDIESLIRKSVKEWLSLETYIFIYGEHKVKEILNEKKLSDCFEQLNIGELQREQQIKYMSICKRLQLQEMADEKFDNAHIGNSRLKPLPDYKQLKEVSKDLTVKVKSFYNGMVYEKEDTNFPTKIVETSEKDEEEPPAVMPFVDINSQNAIRRKVFLTSVNKSMQQLLQALRITNFSSVLSDFQALVKTFNLQANNIVFKPFIWNYIAVILLHVLAIRDESIHKILEEKHSKTYIELQFNSIPNKSNFIKDIMTTIEDINLFLESYISSK
ncbi:hypothetical protein NQ317_001563 [Molorchus minor]|uniref:RNA polymerase II subunit B1 CTD phosphatase RPAP2 homolog n=1 Tax=Molorchus minor TaxID=1323400 RepID=A0ABQ9J6I3_9CUCU|nr:hypothetical protein NQ317_001563 [Molorchus minor]